MCGGQKRRVRAHADLTESEQVLRREAVSRTGAGARNAWNRFAILMGKHVCNAYHIKSNNANPRRWSLMQMFVIYGRLNEKGVMGFRNIRSSSAPLLTLLVTDKIFVKSHQAPGRYQQEQRVATRLFRTHSLERPININEALIWNDACAYNTIITDIIIINFNIIISHRRFAQGVCFMWACISCIRYWFVCILNKLQIFDQYSRGTRRPATG